MTMFTLQFLATIGIAAIGFFVIAGMIALGVLIARLLNHHDDPPPPTRRSDRTKFTVDGIAEDYLRDMSSVRRLR